MLAGIWAPELFVFAIVVTAYFVLRRGGAGMPITAPPADDRCMYSTAAEVEAQLCGEPNPYGGQADNDRATAREG